MRGCSGEGEAMMQGRHTGLWRHADFLKLWAGETISLLGSQVTLLAIPLLAAVRLQATPSQVRGPGASCWRVLSGFPANARRARSSGGSQQKTASQRLGGRDPRAGSWWWA